MLERTFPLFLIIILVGLNGVFVWRDYVKGKNIVELDLKLYDANLKIRLLESERIFGSTFIPHFETTDLNENEVNPPYFGSQDLLLFFFQHYDCGTCLDLMSELGSRIKDRIPVIGIAHSDSGSAVQSLLEQYNVEFPVYLAPSRPFRMLDSPYCVLVDKYKNILYLTNISINTQVPLLTSEITKIIERR